MEIWDGYLADGSLANIDLVRGEPIPKGLYHLVCEILVRHTDGDYLLMQRDFRFHVDIIILHEDVNAFRVLINDIHDRTGYRLDVLEKD